MPRSHPVLLHSLPLYRLQVRFLEEIWVSRPMYTARCRLGQLEYESRQHRQGTDFSIFYSTIFSRAYHQILFVIFILNELSTLCHNLPSRDPDCAGCAGQHRRYSLRLCRSDPAFPERLSRKRCLCSKIYFSDGETTTHTLLQGENL